MTVAWPSERDHGWLRCDELGPDVVAVRVTGAASGGRADELWSAVESAVESAEGRTVVVDLTRLTGFDQDTVESLMTIARTSRRRHDDVRLVLRPGSAMHDRLRHRGVAELLVVEHGLGVVARPESDRACGGTPFCRLSA